MIFLECNADEYLIKSLGFPKKIVDQIKHQRGKGQVVNAVSEKRKVVGIVDEDPGSAEPGKMREYTESLREGDIGLLIHRDDPTKKIIKISPRLEEWMYKRAGDNKIDPKDFHLPDNPDGLHRIPHYERKKDFKDFLGRLIELDREMRIMKDWITSALGQ